MVKIISLNHKKVFKQKSIKSDMFGKKECNSCKKKMSSNHNFCPYCGNSSSGKTKKEDYGMLGEDDYANEFEQFSNSLFGAPGGKMIGKMFESAVKMLEKEMKKEMKKTTSKQQVPKTNFQIFINGEKVNLKEHSHPQKIIREKNIVYKELPRGNLKKFSSLPKKEPKTSVRRFSDKVVYEVLIPGVRSLKDISIINLENNIEIKAIAKNKAYEKLIPITFPITNYEFSKGKLVLELEEDEF